MNAPKSIKLNVLLDAMRLGAKVTLNPFGSRENFTGIPFDLSYDKKNHWGEEWFVVLMGDGNVMKRCQFIAVEEHS